MRQESNTLTYYSVSPKAIDALKAILKLDDVQGVEGETTLSGDTPLGKVTMQVGYAPGSGQLSVVVLDKPRLLTMETISAHIKTAIAAASAADEVEPVKPSEPVPVKS